VWLATFCNPNFKISVLSKLLSSEQEPVVFGSLFLFEFSLPCLPGFVFNLYRLLLRSVAPSPDATAEIEDIVRGEEPDAKGRCGTLIES
jgi:hypothetical protein